MTKNDLKCGMVAKLRNGLHCVVIDNALYSNWGKIYISDLSSDMRFVHDRSYDVSVVYHGHIYSLNIENSMPPSTIIWSR